eukprot:PhM_4_TR10436/c2_g1_i1/m.77970
MNTDNNNSNNLIEHFRTLYGFGYHPTATSAIEIFLRVSTLIAECNFQLSVFTAEEVLSFCVDTTQVLVVDITDSNSDFSNSTARTCLVVDDTPDRAVARTHWPSHAPPEHYIFSPMSVHRALDWLQRWNPLPHSLSDRLYLTFDMYRTDSTLGDLKLLLDHFHRECRFLLTEIALPSVAGGVTQSIGD